VGIDFALRLGDNFADQRAAMAASTKEAR